MSLFKRKSKDTGNDVYAFISGNTIPITEVNDPVFSAKTLGDGLAIIPSGELICAPCAGTISMVAEGSNHAVGMTLANGAEILIHVGLDTVSLNGKGFKILVKEGQKVKAKIINTNDNRVSLSMKALEEIMPDEVEDEESAQAEEYISNENASTSLGALLSGLKL